MSQSTGARKQPKKRKLVPTESSTQEDRPKRSPNWSQDENTALINAVAENYDKLVGKFSSTISLELKNKLWKGVVDAVNSLGNNKRSVNDVRTKWTDLRSRTKAKATAQIAAWEKTGGGKAEDLSMDRIEAMLTMLTAAEKVVVRLGGKQWLLGIEGGLDTSMMDSSPSANDSQNNHQEPGSSRSLALALIGPPDNDVFDNIDQDLSDGGIPEPDPEEIRLPRPATKKNRVRREASEVTIELLNAEKDNNVQFKRIGDSLEQLVYFKRVQLGLETLPD